MRALEVLAATGRPLSSFRVPGRPADPGRFRLVGLQRPREELVVRIDARVEAMRAAGFAEEVRELLARGYARTCPGLRGIGYRELAAAGGTAIGGSVGCDQTQARDATRSAR